MAARPRAQRRRQASKTPPPPRGDGMQDAHDLRVGIVVSRFNERFTERLLEGALDCLRQHGAPHDATPVLRVPGAFEIPVVARTLAMSGQVDAVVCLGAVVRGATPHFDLVAQSAAQGVTRAALDSGIPVTFGVLTTDTPEQALERSRTNSDNKGWEAALAAIETANVLRQLRRDTR
jgi:6,7-dimethyl-8-ribityllumazine synthase